MKKVQMKNGEEVLLREPQKSDALDIIQFYDIVTSETNYISYAAGEYDLTVEEQEEFIEEINESDNNTVVLAIIDSKVVGLGKIISHKKKKARHVGVLAIAIRDEYCNLGIGRIIMNYLIDWCKSNGVTRKISLSVRKDNPRAIAVYEKCGFEIEGVLKNERYIDGEFFDIVVMGLTI
ncbi:GNAT family N-acetyltransferase [Asaccharospora irregularis]|uniref:Protein N-acetyltransferase, RimJ/RimL family n=1 Tax=Asaccharospora irregularis DSM 2635 TaxID=1121321 RepID=A0A1M5QU50_9FIRM|nr:GNAT family protein [Asaccharospora irregularis]SHH17488.1 Protein N-acetyltransferase, RimJ/RimL family [Asaccharospora irregularis DSM 2635]